MQNVFTGTELFCCIIATTIDESMPPDKKAPNGTSDRIAKQPNAESVAQARRLLPSRSKPSNGCIRPRCATSSADQKKTRLLPWARGAFQT